uniref:Tubulin-specific chaperone A n=1 Tax=Cyprinus carpio TaxID=7962 RepID=A0A8C2K3F6_CYPCA
MFNKSINFLKNKNLTDPKLLNGSDLAKEEVLYIKEAKQQEEKIERLKAEAGDEYLIKKQMEVLQESRMMIPDCHRRLAIAHADLQQLLMLLHKMLTLDGLELRGLLVDYCNVFISCLDSHSAGTHSLQSIHW